MMTKGTQKVCHICNSSNKEVFKIPLYSEDGDWLTPVYQCVGCGTYMRGFDYSSPKMMKHFSLSTYTNLKNEERLKREKEDYFRFIVRQCLAFMKDDIKAFDAEALNANPVNILDVGSCFGHLLDIFSAYNFQTFGIEPFNALYNETVSRKRHRLFKSIGDIPEDIRFDLVTILDTLYLIEDPVSTLMEIRKKMRSKGMLVIRIVNRVWIIDTLRMFGLSVTSRIFGDHKYSFSLKGMQILLSRSGFKIKQVIKREHGKIISDAKRRLLANTLIILSHLSGVVLSPGLIYFCRPMNN